ncbi:hypothetical protein [Halanaerobium salsuginis]|uniref:Uncharacterized protein n=1 Tax=Halanaerobium salsuginis TaxID=29563 RepID=A0A1I4F0W4_9FIRM|nr:hypothetical protein [Halanaerobium salsuginis]SFL10031.1 hypothetical protein SAMN02983006_00186 [Halanaerobium salsuginis]
MKIKNCKVGMKIKCTTTRREKSSYKGDIETISGITDNGKYIWLQGRSGIFNPKFFEPYNKVKAKILLEIETDFNDKISDETTVKYCLEEDLKELGWQINKSKLIYDQAGQQKGARK